MWADDTYEKVTSTSQLTAGEEYLIVYENGNSSTACGAISTTSTKYGISVGVAVSSSSITITNQAVTSFVLGGSSDAWTFKFPSTNNYLTWSSGNSLNKKEITGNTTLSNNEKWTVSISNGTTTITNNATSGSNTRYLKYNSGSNQERFACYTTGQNNVSLYKKADATVVAKPTFNKGTDTYNNDQSVTLSCTTTGATIYYTTDGSAPSSSSTPYTEAITVNATQTIKAIGIKDGLTDSEVAEATYTMVVSNPTFTVDAGTYNGAKSVELECATTGASIRYTTNGAEPTTSSTLYEGAISVNVSQTIKAKAFKTGYTDSEVSEAAYTLKCATPTITKADGDFVTTKVITMTSSDGASIYYTTDGTTEPTTSSTPYDPDNKPVISSTTTFKAIAVKDGWTNSEVKTQDFTKQTVIDGMTALVGKTNTSAQDYYVNLTDAQVTWTNGARLGYIEDASRGAYWSSGNDANSPTKNKVYNGIFKVSYQYNNSMPTVKYMINVEGTITDGNDKAPTIMTPAALDEAFTANLGRQIQINNFTVATGKKLSENITLYGTDPYVNVTVGHTYTLVGYPYNSNGTYQFRVVTAIEAPTFSPEEGIFYDAFDLTLSCATADVTIYYTTNGDVPTKSSTQYDSEHKPNISATTTVKAIAVKNGVESPVAEATYTYYSVKQPTFVTASPVYYNDKAEVTCETAGSSLYYTLTTDGSEPATPTSASTAYPDGGITIAANTVKIKVIAKNGDNYSPVAEATYTLKTPDAPTATPGASIVESGSTVILNSRAGTTIYYTTDGTTVPDNTSTPYSGAITIDADKTIKAIAIDGAGNSSSVLTAAYQIYTDAAFSVADMTIEVGDKVAPSVTTDSEGTVSFESGNTDIATIVDGKVNGVAKGTVTITANITASGTKHAASTTFKVTVKNPAVWESTSQGIDELTYTKLGLNTSSTGGYANFSGKSDNSSAIYAGQGYNKTNLGYIQIRSKNSNSGIVTTTSGGKARKVVIDWNPSTSTGRYVSIYGKDEAYTDATDLFDDDENGTLLGTITYGTSTELKITGDYEFIGIKANDALYMNSIKIYWEGDAVSLSDDANYTPVAKDYAKVTLNRKFVAGWNGIILPFDLTDDVKTALGATEVKTLDDATLSGNVVSLSFADATLPVDAGTPVLVKLAAAQESGDVVLNGVEIKTTDPTTIAKTVEDNTFTLTGTYSQANLTSSEVYLVSNKTFYHKAAGNALTAKPFRSYIVQTGPDGARMLNVNFDLEGGTTTGIVEVSGNGTKDNNQNQYYDLQGRKVAKPNKGIYIVNGKKVVIK
jgi:hypothetical protein